jgi:deferrochelatase/peroxidase EfeB
VPKGAPIDLSPDVDNPELRLSNDFAYDPQSQARCPYTAHTRKCTPRSDLFVKGKDLGERNRIWRRGITFGPEVSEMERTSHQTVMDRGLLFKCFQSNLENGFQFIQKSKGNLHYY